MNDAFDLDAYLARIGYTGPRLPRLSVLQAIHALHPATIPFENLDPLLGRRVLLDLASLQAKLVGARRGGYCFEHNMLLGAALGALGFRVTGLAGRVRWMAPPEQPARPRTHMLLRVDLDEGAYLADVGFGSHLIAAPILLETDSAQQTPASLLRLLADDGAFTLQTQLPMGWQDVYRFTLEAAVAADYEMGNWFTSTHPTSRFIGNLLAERLTPFTRYTLFNKHLTSRHTDGSVEERDLVGAEDLGDVLDAVFHITLPVAAREIWARLP